MSADVGSAIWSRVLREVPRDKQSPSGNVRAGTEPTHVQERTTVKSCLLSLSSASSRALGPGTLDTHVHMRAHKHTKIQLLSYWPREAIFIGFSATNTPFPILPFKTQAGNGIWEHFFFKGTLTKKPIHVASSGTEILIITLSLEVKCVICYSWHHISAQKVLEVGVLWTLGWGN